MHGILADQSAGVFDESLIRNELLGAKAAIGVGQDLFDVGVRKLREPVFQAAHPRSARSRTAAAISATDRGESSSARA